MEVLILKAVVSGCNYTSSRGEELRTVRAHPWLV